MRIKEFFTPRKAGCLLTRTIHALAEWRSIKKLSRHMGADRITKHDRKALKTYLKSTTVGRVL
jgi:hypothetical protein